MSEPTQYALLYERMGLTTHRVETVVGYYTGEDRNFKQFEYIDLPYIETAKQMVAQGWTDLGTGGPQSILLRKDN